MSDEKNTVDKQDDKQQPVPMRTVMVAAPSYDGKVGVWHVAALTESIKIGLMNNINILPLYVSYDALVQRARNDIFKIAHDSQVDDLVFIDTDVDWAPQDLFRLLSHDVDIVAAPVIKKNDNPTFSVKLLGQFVVEDNGLMIVDGVATGFMRIRKSAIQKIWDTAEEYKEVGKAEPSRMVFDVKVVDGDLWSEDIVFCDTWTRLGGKVYVDPLINCGHSGEKRWVGNFYEWIKLFSRR